ncbi:MAG: hypothetical protein ACE5IW_02820 [bacterium]
MKRELTQRERILTALALAGASVYLLTKLVIAPLISDWQQTELEITKRQAQYINTLRFVHRAERIQAEAQGNKQSLSNSARIAEFLQEIEAAAGPRVVIRRFQPLRASLDKSYSKTKGQVAAMLQVQIECLGKLPDLLVFFERIEAKDALTRIRHFYLTPEGSGKERLQCQLIVVRMLVA